MHAGELEVEVPMTASAGNEPVLTVIDARVRGRPRHPADAVADNRLTVCDAV